MLFGLKCLLSAKLYLHSSFSLGWDLHNMSSSIFLLSIFVCISYVFLNGLYSSFIYLSSLTTFVFFLIGLFSFLTCITRVDKFTCKNSTILFCFTSSIFLFCLFKIDFKLVKILILKLNKTTKFNFTFSGN